MHSAKLKNSTSFNEDFKAHIPTPKGIRDPRLGPSEEQEEEDDGFFCSELVAAAYQALGMLPEGKPASSFWPSTLAREDLNDGMLDGTKMSRLVYLERK